MIKSRSVRQSMVRESQRQSDARRGQYPSVLRFSGSSLSEALTPDVNQLPHIENEGTLQDADGNFLNLDGYSLPGGPDIGS